MSLSRFFSLLLFLRHLFPCSFPIFFFLLLFFFTGWCLHSDGKKMSTSLTSSLFTSASPSSLKECQNLWRVHPVVSQQWEQKNKQLFQDFFGDPLGFFGFFMAGWWRTLPDALGFFCLAPPPLRLRLCCQLIAFTRFFFFYILVIAEILRGFFCCFVAVEWCLIPDEFVAFFEEPQIWVFFCLAFCLWRPTQLRFSLRRSFQIFFFFSGSGQPSGRFSSQVSSTLDIL